MRRWSETGQQEDIEEMIEVYDNLVPFHIQQKIYYMTVNSHYELGWGDRDDISQERLKTLLIILNLEFVLFQFVLYQI